VSETSVTIETLADSWFARASYKPRLATADGTAWFPLARRDWITTDLDSTRESSDALTGLGDALTGLGDALDSTYVDWQLPRGDRVDANLRALADGSATCVVTGQQPGFLGGPAFTLYKAVSAIATARCLTELRGRPCVPVFWVASEDHDIDEVRQGRFPDASFELPHVFERRPLSTLAIDGIADDVLRAASDHFSSRRFGEIATKLIDGYRSRNVASGFANLLASVFGEYGLVVVDPEKLRPLGAPIVRSVIENPSEAIERIEHGVRDVEAEGLPAFVRPRLPLFLLRDGRRDHLSPAANGNLVVDGGGPEISRDEALAILDESPERFSTGALLRPLVQEFVLPSVLTIGGAAEVGYFAQLGPLAEWLGVPRPPIALRLGATVLDGKVAKHAKKLGLDAESIADAERAEDWFGTSDNESSIRQTLRDDVAKLRLDVSSLRSVLAAEHPELEKNIARGTDRVENALAQFESKVGDLIDRANSDRVASAELVWSGVFPEGLLQERHFGFLHLIARHGTSWIDQLIDEITDAPLDVTHRFIWFGER